MFIGHITAIILSTDPDVHTLRTSGLAEDIANTRTRSTLKSAIGATTEECAAWLRSEVQAYLTARNIKGEQRKGWRFEARFSEVQGGMFWRDPAIGCPLGGYDVWES